MEILRCFDSISAIELQADLEIINKENFKICFDIYDKENKILFPTTPAIGRHHELWKQTCFELFFRLKNKKQYFEVNLSPTQAWNVYEFMDYRMPQPPQEFKNVKKVEINSNKKQISADIFFNELDLSQMELSFCAVLLLNDGRTTYWSTHHADSKPNFHHQDSFTIQRKIL